MSSSTNSRWSRKARVLESGGALQNFNSSIVTRESLKELMSDSGQDDPAFRERKRFTCFTEEDAALLKDLGEVFERHADEVVDRFYDHLGQFAPLQPLLDDADLVQRLKGFQRRYLLSLVSGCYDDAYADQRRKIGRVHDRAGLDAQWFVGTYGLYFDQLVPLIREHFDDVEEAFRATGSLAKLMILDMQLVLDSYYGFQQKHALEKSEHLAAVGELAASIAHEVRNPLAGMKGALQILREELSVKPANQEIMDELLAQIERLEHLVRDLLSYAKPQAVRKQTFDLHELLDRHLRLYKDETDRADVTVQRVYGPYTASMVADPQQLEQVFMNLIFNALQAMEAGGTLTVTTRACKRGTIIEFNDTGKGIPESELSRVLQPFFTTKHRGSGLGLSIVKKIAEAHGESVQIDSQLGTGTSVKVTLPAGRVSP
jgi:signal transduction histidine kinase